MKKLRKMVGPVDPNTPKKTATTKASRKDGTTPAGIKKTRKPVAGGKAKKGKAAVNISDAGMSPIAPSPFVG